MHSRHPDHLSFHPPLDRLADPHRARLRTLRLPHIPQRSTPHQGAQTARDGGAWPHTRPLLSPHGTRRRGHFVHHPPRHICDGQ